MDGVEFYNDHYRKNPDKWNAPDRDRMVLNALSEPATLLDIGCGNGHTIRFLMDFWPDTVFYGLDISDVAIEIAKKKIPSADFWCGTLESVPLGKFNAITLLGVAEHFEDLGDLAKVKEHLSPGGVLYLEVPNCLAYSDSDDEGFRKSGGSSKQIEWHLRRETWVQIIMDCGFEISKSLTGARPSWEFIWVLR